ncbi:hypothetical protein PHJA_001948400 [Phtheirospermum japonicum]|uniref:Uncharacterized protein n=1 Tax=Phtheirospermum japonicum TaxID=374723 RepID=A0A830CQC3_9LAMI|nr:hypothetical protein PHJA_001948400 [Phtheirospermum japonicum]
MRDLASCFSEHAVQISDTSCSNCNYTPSTQNAVVCLYETVLSTQKQILTTVTWTKNSSFQGLTINFNDGPISNAFKLNTNNSRFFRKMKGSKALELSSPHASKIEVSWDLSTARYRPGPEPVDGFYLFVAFDSEIGLVLGDAAPPRMVKHGARTARFSLISRREHFSGRALYSTRARFCDAGSDHDIVIRCGEEEKYPFLSVCIDEKTVIRVKRLQWNFRGNETIFLDGRAVDMMWDVHDWLYGRESGNAIFMFRTRSGLDSRLWLEDKLAQKGDDDEEKDKVEFSLMICACKNV